MLTGGSAAQDLGVSHVQLAQPFMLVQEHLAFHGRLLGRLLRLDARRPSPAAR